ncbi:MAG: cysteine synthase A [Urechidicola sp.]|jgi:cysteine synthase A
MRDWINQAVKIIESDQQRSVDTHLVKLNIPAFQNIDIYLNDESTHPTGSLKHRLARSLFLYALCNGWIKQDTPIVEASSGSTAVLETYFAQMIGVPFIAGTLRICLTSRQSGRLFYGSIYLCRTPNRLARK